MMNLFSSVVGAVSNTMWEPFMKSWLMVLLLIVFVLCLYFFVSFKAWNNLQKVEKDIVYQYDNVFYLLSMFYYKHMDSLNSNPWLIVLKGIWWSWKSKYIPNKKIIEDTILKIENKLWVKIVSEDEWNNLSKLFKKYKFRTMLFLIIKVLIVLLLIFLIVLLIFVLLWNNS